MSSFRAPHHLPNLSGGTPADPERLPRQRRGTTPQMHGRYPDYDVLAEAGHWDDVTRRVVFGRLDPPPMRFFDDAEAATLDALCDVVTAQDRDPRIPVLRMIDRKFAEGEHDGFRYAGMPADGDTWKLVARGLDEEARRPGAEVFATLDGDGRLEVCRRFIDGELKGGVWDEIDISTAWRVVSRGIVSEFYSHPWAWNEIGYAGPAYPRGFARLGVGMSEAWEGVEASGFQPEPEEQRA
jgi:hypothetical protein